MRIYWRRHPDLNRGIADLQSAALPLGYDAILVCRLFASLQTLCSGAGNETRTRYLHLGKVALYRMSYARKMVPPVGVEPTTRGFSVRCSTY